MTAARLSLPDGFDMRVIANLLILGDQRRGERPSGRDDHSVSRILVKFAGKFDGLQRDFVVDRNES